MWLYLFSTFIAFLLDRTASLCYNTYRKKKGIDETAILFDDNAKVREGWHMGEAYDPTTCDICEMLKQILGLEDEE